MANISKVWIGSVTRKLVDGTEYVFTGRDSLTVNDAAHRAELRASGCFEENENDLEYIAKVSVIGDDGALYEVDAIADLTVDNTNIANVPAGEIQDPA